MVYTFWPHPNCLIFPIGDDSLIITGGSMEGYFPDDKKTKVFDKSCVLNVDS